MAELADALDSKSGIRKGVWVRPPPSAPTFVFVMALRTICLGPNKGGNSRKEPEIRGKSRVYEGDFPAIKGVKLSRFFGPRSVFRVNFQA